ncbi:hypothetical protein BDB00DRAFT_805142 [Zychaea mexicana]|uniref:uncharacterized protein n=1 Tax=Zychaea mexicana TaxID=64656 RepID=UPI0022FE4D86|nr:uncharacterized protein BDB00DRAFT_805142 [Zychaea mexicana]KAI9497142.1 hypothetical protein BDB00DRAFT_805142 [Zychaea mexicana]
MHHFPTSLPTDIVYSIFKYLDQADCVECMRVCRQWYFEIPSYAIHLWEQLLISPESWQASNECMLSCLGPQVQKVTLDRLNACSIINKLRKTGCEITVLG